MFRRIGLGREGSEEKIIEGNRSGHVKQSRTETVRACVGMENTDKVKGRSKDPNAK